MDLVTFFTMYLGRVNVWFTRFSLLIMIRKVTRGRRTGKIYPKGWKCISDSGGTSIVRRLPPPGTRPAIISFRRSGRWHGQTATTTCKAIG